MSEGLRPGTQDVDVRVVLDIEDAARAHCLHDVRVAQHAKRGNEPVALGIVGDPSRLVERDTQLPRLDGVDDDLGVGRDDELRPLPGGHRPQLVIDGVLKDHVQVCVRLVQQQRRALPGVEEGEQHQDLMETAARARDVQRRTVFRCLVLRADVRAAGIGRQQPVAEQFADRRLERGPGGIVPVRGDEQVAQDLAGAAEAEDLFHRDGLK